MPERSDNFKCVCGSQWFRMVCALSVAEDDDPGLYTPGGWSSEIECFSCYESYNLARIHMGTAFDEAIADLEGEGEAQ